MKDNRKNRKLKYIRVKNKLRLGQDGFYCLAKMHVYTPMHFIQDFIENSEALLLKQYKLVLPEQELFSGWEGDDFIKDQYTVRIRLSKNKR